MRETMPRTYETVQDPELIAQITEVLLVCKSLRCNRRNTSVRATCPHHFELHPDMHNTVELPVEIAEANAKAALSHARSCQIGVSAQSFRQA